MNAENKLFPGNTTTALGHQLKYLHNDKWYKVDHYGYEAASEYVSSHLVKFTNIPTAIAYSITTVSINGVEYTACCSPNFIRDEILVSSSELFLKFRNLDIEKTIEAMNIKDKIEYFVSSIEEITGIQNYGAVLSQMLDYDAFILNEGRTFDNIHFIYSEHNGFSPAPLFDFGDALLSDIRRKYPHSLSFKEAARTIQSKPFDSDFSKQTSTCHSLYGKHLTINKSISISPEINDTIRHYYGDYICERINFLVDRQISLHREEFAPKQTSIFENSFDAQLQLAKMRSAENHKNRNTIGSAFYER